VGLLVYNPSPLGVGIAVDRNMGALDSPGTVVHITSGLGAGGGLVVGNGGFGRTTCAAQPSHDGDRAASSGRWFGFNAGSASRRELSTRLRATHLAAASATLSWMFTEWIHRRKPTVSAASVRRRLVHHSGLRFVTPLRRC